MIPNSFQWGKINSLSDWGMKCIAADPLFPEKRDNRIRIPRNSISAKQHGKRFYNDRLIPVRCVMVRKLSRHELRYIAYELNQERELTLWEDPDLHYVAEAYASSELITWMGEVGREFTIEFEAQPFAYSTQRSEAITSGSNRLTYEGTEEAPCLIVLKNDSPFPISNIQIMTIKKES